MHVARCLCSDLRRTETPKRAPSLSVLLPAAAVSVSVACPEHPRRISLGSNLSPVHPLFMARACSHCLLPNPSPRSPSSFLLLASIAHRPSLTFHPPFHPTSYPRASSHPRPYTRRLSGDQLHYRCRAANCVVTCCRSLLSDYSPHFSSTKPTSDPQLDHGSTDSCSGPIISRPTSRPTSASRNRPTLHLLPACSCSPSRG